MKLLSVLRSILFFILHVSRETNLNCKDMLDMVKQAEDIMTAPKPLVIFHPDAQYDETTTMREAEKKGLFPNHVDIKLSPSVQSTRHGYYIPNPNSLTNHIAPERPKTQWKMRFGFNI